MNVVYTRDGSGQNLTQATILQTRVTQRIFLLNIANFIPYIAKYIQAFLAKKWGKKLDMNLTQAKFC